MNLVLTPNQSDIFAALRAFLLAILPGGDAIFSAQINGTEMSVTKILAGAIAIGDAVIGPCIAPGTIVLAAGTGTGATGTYNLSQAFVTGAAILATGVPVIQGQQNRVAESPAADFCVMWPIGRERIETNIESSADAKFAGSIAGDVLTITQVYSGALAVGSPIFGVGVAAGTQVFRLGTGTGGVGTYAIAPAQTVATTILSAGQTQLMQPTKIRVQIDVHGPNSGDNAQIISTAFRDDYAVAFFAALNPNITPLYADDPRQQPFSNAEDQFENRWIVEAWLQANQTLLVPQQYADAVTINLVDVDVVYPPS